MGKVLSRYQNLPPQLQWKYAHEPALMEWTIRARDYNTLVADCMFGFMSVLAAGGALIMYSVYEGMSEPWRSVSSVCFLFIGLFVTSCMTHQRVNFAYRLTLSGVEYCEWKNFPKWALAFLKWFTVITALVLVSLASVDPTFLLGALIGPGGAGLLYLSMANSKSFQAMHTEYHHHFFKWSELTRSVIASNRHLVELAYSMPRADSIYMCTGSLYVFFERKNKTAVVAVIEAHLLPDVECVVGKVDVLN